MATRIRMGNPVTGLSKDGFYGFSWTTLFFGGFPALFRGDFLTFIGLFAVMAILGLMTMGVGAFVGSIFWAFMYNGFYTKKLIEKGYQFAGTEAENNAALAALGIKGSANVTDGADVGTSPMSIRANTLSMRRFDGERDLLSDSYRIYLGKKYGIEKNTMFEKFTVGEQVFDDLNNAVEYCHSLEDSEITKEEKSASKFIGDSKWKYRMLENDRVEITNSYGGVTEYDSIDAAKKELTWWR